MEKNLKVAKEQLASLKMPKVDMPKMPKLSLPKVTKKQAMIAAGVAGATLLCTIAGYSIIAIRNSRKRVNFDKMKIQVLDRMKSAKETLAPYAEMASDYAVKAAKDAHAKVKSHLN